MKSRNVKLRRMNVHVFKMVLGGAGGVGKTSIRRRYLGSGFKGEYLQTLGADFALKNSEMVVKGKKLIIQWQIWDLAGQPTFDVIRRVYINGARAALVVYDVTRPSTLEDVQLWCKEIWCYSGEREKIPIVLVGNKIDLRKNDDASGKYVQREEGAQVAESLNLPFIETSALTGENINEAFAMLGKIVLERYR